VPDRHNEHEDLIVQNLIENAVVPHAQAIDARFSRERLDSRRARVVLKGKDPLVESLLCVPGEGQERAFG
jgi:hypothetical protein